MTEIVEPNTRNSEIAVGILEASSAESLKTQEFSVSVRQEPIRGRMCGLGGVVAKRMLDPPFIVQLDFGTRREFTEEEVATVSQRYLAQVTIHTVNGLDGELKDGHVLITQSPSRPGIDQSQYLATLLGQRCASPVYLDDCSDGKKRFFFVFSDLAIRIQGDYVLKCSIIDIFRCQAKIVLSKTFQIYPPQSYPGILEPTNLSKSLYVQGVPLRSGAYSKKLTSYDSVRDFVGGMTILKNAADLEEENRRAV